MAKPPQSPPNSDIDGVNEDRAPINRAENSRPDPGEALDHARKQNKGRPPAKGG